MLDMIVSQASSTFRVIGSRSRSLWLFLEKHCHRSLSTFINGFLFYYINVGYGNISSKFSFQVAGLKVNVTGH